MSEWLEQSNCVGYDTNIFFPERGDMQTIALAKSICRECVVVKECLEVNLYEKDGVWGGLSGNERRSLRRFNR